METTNPRELLERLLKVIQSDIAHIEDDSKSGKLEHQVTLDVTRYTGALLDIVKALDGADRDERRRLSELSNEELVALAEVAVSQLKSK